MSRPTALTIPALMLGVAEGASDRDHALARFDGGAVGERERREMTCGDRDMDHGSVARRVCTDERGFRQVPSLNRTVIFVAPLTTWAAVTMLPLES
jgi:hypothetical protein